MGFRVSTENVAVPSRSALMSFDAYSEKDRFPLDLRCLSALSFRSSSMYRDIVLAIILK